MCIYIYYNVLPFQGFLNVPGHRSSVIGPMAGKFLADEIVWMNFSYLAILLRIFEGSGFSSQLTI